MDNFLTTLYFKKFERTAEAKRLRNIHDFDSEISNARNDEKIYQADKQIKLINELIVAYMGNA